MPPFAKFHPATLIDLHSWSTLSRNEVRPFLERFGIEPLGSKYPMLRVYEAVLGLSPVGDVEDDMLGQGLIRLGEVAGRVGQAPDTVLKKLRAGKTDFPPLYVFGPNRHMMLRAQVEEMLASPRNAWHALVRSRATPCRRHGWRARSRSRKPGSTRCWRTSATSRRTSSRGGVSASSSPMQPTGCGLRAPTRQPRRKTRRKPQRSRTAA